MASILMARKSKIFIPKIIGLIGDEDTLIGFLLAGVGDEGSPPNKRPNFMICDAATTTAQIEEFVHHLLVRSDIAIVFVATDVAERIRPMMRQHQAKLLEIPTKMQPFDPETDEILRMARLQLSTEDRD